MNFNKMKQQLEGFLHPQLALRIQYRQNGYRYQPEKKVQCYMTVDQIEIFNTKLALPQVKWYKAEQDILNDTEWVVSVTREDIDHVRSSLGDGVPSERLHVIAKDRKRKYCAKAMFQAQEDLFKSDFQKVALTYLSNAVETSLASESLLLNIFALIDRRVGQKRLASMEELIKTKHPVVRYFYSIRLGRT